MGQPPEKAPVKIFRPIFLENPHRPISTCYERNDGGFCATTSISPSSCRSGWRVRAGFQWATRRGPPIYLQGTKPRSPLESVNRCEKRPKTKPNKANQSHRSQPGEANKRPKNQQEPELPWDAKPKQSQATPRGKPNRDQRKQAREQHRNQCEIVGLQLLHSRGGRDILTAASASWRLRAWSRACTSNGT